MPFQWHPEAIKKEKKKKRMAVQKIMYFDENHPKNPGFNNPCIFQVF